jgi:hypothetical protein
MRTGLEIIRELVRIANATLTTTSLEDIRAEQYKLGQLILEAEEYLAIVDGRVKEDAS